MADTAWIAFGSAVGGAFVGGVATAVGSYYVSRSERRHKVWGSLYFDLMPEFRAALDRGGLRPAGGGRNADELMDDIIRSAMVGGRGCLRCTEALQTAFKAQTLVSPEDADAKIAGEPEGPRRIARQVSLNTAVARLDSLLARSLEDIGLPRRSWRRLLGWLSSRRKAAQRATTPYRSPDS